jgi:hypothetical protein
MSIAQTKMVFLAEGCSNFSNNTTPANSQRIHLTFSFGKECLDFNLPAYLSEKNSRVNLFIMVTRTQIIDEFIEYVEKNDISILLSNDHFFTVFHSLINGYRHSDFK